MSTHFEDIERKARSLPLKQKAALADRLKQDLGQSGDAATEQLEIRSHVGPHDLVMADRCRTLVKTNGYSVEGLAKKVKKCRTVIRELLSLDKNKLGDVGYRGFRNGDFSKSVSVLILTIPDKKQRDKFATEVRTGGQHGKPMSFRPAKEWKQQHYMKELKGAPFPLDQQIDPSWPYSCLTCPHYNGNTPERRQGKRSDICLNPPHYRELVRLYEIRVGARTKE